MNVEVRRCRADEVPAVMAFVEQHWKAGHVLATSRDLFEWQYRSPVPGELDVMTAWAGNDLLGILGFVDTATYDPALAGRSTVWLALWKVRDDAGVAGLGLRLLRAVQAAVPHEAIGVLGIGDPRHHAMYRALGYEPGTCDHHVVFHPDRPLVLGRVEGAPRPVGVGGSATIEPLAPADLLAAAAEVPTDAERVPTRTGATLRGRFVDHPFYRYDLHLLRRDGRPRGILVTRRAEHDGVAALRIVDVLGDPAELAEVGSAVESLLVEADAEYADLWVAGVAPAVPAAAGFGLAVPGGPIVAPTLFEPFVAENVALDYAIRTGGRPYAVYRADGDQDRPNRVPS